MTINREDVLAQAQQITEALKGFNDCMEEAAPIVLPELARFLNNIRPVADMLTDYLMGAKYQAAVRYDTASQIALKLLERGYPTDEVAKEADRITRELQKVTQP